jgi:hypothetical protein
LALHIGRLSRRLGVEGWARKNDCRGNFAHAPEA